MVTAKEIQILHEVKYLLKPLKLATQEISGEKYITLSVVIPMVHNLDNSIQAVAVNTVNIGENSTVASSKAGLLKELTMRLGAVEQVYLLSITNSLDPRFKKLYFKNPINCARATL